MVAATIAAIIAKKVPFTLFSILVRSSAMLFSKKVSSSVAASPISV